MFTGLMLVLAALALGTLAIVITGGGSRTVLALFAGGLLGAGIGLWLAAIDGLFAGVLLGAASGAILSRARR